MKRFFIILLFSVLISSCEDKETLIYQIDIINHQFTPSEIIVKSGKRIKLSINNKDETIEEFESLDLNREKLIPGKSSVNIYVGPLKPGSYSFFGEFNQESAQGKIIVKEK